MLNNYLKLYIFNFFLRNLAIIKMNRNQFLLFIASSLFFICYIIVLDVLMKDPNISRFNAIHQKHTNRGWSFTIFKKKEETSLSHIMKTNKHTLGLIITIFIATSIQSLIVSNKKLKNYLEERYAYFVCFI